MNVHELIAMADWLYKSALSKAHDADLAEELVQETYLHALKAIADGRAIANPRAYLYGLLSNRFYLRLREKYRRVTVSFEALPSEPASDEDALSAIIASEEYAAVRRELAFMARLYRETMLRYYLRGENVAEIARALNVPKGTVLSRLSAGRDKIRKGLDTMKTYSRQSYLPERLSIGVNGRSGLGGEPFSCAKSSLEQNILIMAYERPLSVQALSDALGVPAPYVEDCADRLVDAELMARQGEKVFTNFMIFDEADHRRSVDVSKAFAASTFDDANPIFQAMLAEYAGIDALRSWCDTQKYVYASLNAAMSAVYVALSETGIAVRDFDDVPARPNFGKWEAVGSRYASEGDGVAGDERARYNVSGMASFDDVSPYVALMFEWDTFIGRTHNAKMKYVVERREFAKLLDSARTGDISPFCAELLPDMRRCGFLTSDDKPALPYLSRAEYDALKAINARFANDLAKALSPRAAKTLSENAKRAPSHIPDENLSDLRYTYSLQSLAMAYFWEAARRGVIPYEAGKPYPVAGFVVR